MAEAVRILRIAAGGDGVGRLGDGRTVFVPRTAPGDLIEVTDVRPHRRFARARLGRLVEASPSRAEPRCPHYVADQCGGCQLQHLSLPAQLEARRGFVGDALRRIARRNVPDPEIIPADRVYDYRTKLTLAVGAGRIGLHRYGRSNDVFELDWCHITRPELMTLWRELRVLRSLFPRRLEHLVLRLDRTGGRHVLFHTLPGEVWNGGSRLHQALAGRGQSATLWYQPGGGAARAMAGSPGTFPVTAFEQVHPEAGDVARELAVSALGDVRGRLVWDLYSGIGETTAKLVAAGASVESVEADRQAVAAAEAQGPAARRHLGRVEEVLAELRPPAFVIANPPRAGMDERVTAAFERQSPERVVYISCDPATLARDLLRLPSYGLTAVQAVDLFPQTAHVETVATFERL